MVRVKLLQIVVVFAAVAACGSVAAQTDSDAPLSHGKAIPDPKQQSIDIPFTLSGQRLVAPHAIEIRPASEMTRQDQDLAADAESSIQERAGFESLGFNEGSWSYEQLVCPALPKHLLLRFSRDDGTRQMSMFSAAIPRGGEGRVRIIPIIRRGYSLFSPAPIGALTIAAFNHIRAEEDIGKTADWLSTGLCYAALAGANPQAGQLQSDSVLDQEFPVTIPPTLDVLPNGGAVIRFGDRSAMPQPMEWDMTFDRKGKLLKATHSRAVGTNYRAHLAHVVDLKDAPPPGKQP
jgi:hypothetical protein